ncbi:hypothetical protein [Leptospirillum ferrooxidans]|uniref:hypothetical protein n=1 Tax=Leptospirillum ferrooxidans TaxID=180 RepID=UPI00130535C6|nr:hypothetical protein [Leptospirillum ferrooxidans]
MTMSQKRMKCAHCGEILIREELEDQDFLERTRSIFPVCFECAEELMPEVPSKVSGRKP